VSSHAYRNSLFSLFLVVTALVVVLFSTPSRAQTVISGDIAGTITDPTGATIPGATVSVTSEATGQTKTVTTGAGGDYRVPLLSPGSYKVSVAATGFQTASFDVPIRAGQVTPGDARLAIGQGATTVTVLASSPLLHTDDAQLSTSISMEQVQALPNPGNDLTFVAQTAPGSVMNTQGGYGNFSSFGIPATSNTFTVNGGYENDPFLNVNNSGATNLLLGNNDISDVTITSNAYDAAFGGLGGAQVNEISRSGSNSFHGNAAYWWNGRAMNANDYFNNQTGIARPFDNVNQWAAGFGGPIRRDKTFFFINYEGLRVVLPTRAAIYAPSPAYQAAILNPTPICPTPASGSAPSCASPLAPNGNLAYNGNADEASLYQSIFGYYNNAPGASAALADPNDPDVVIFNGTAGNFTHEYLVSGRIDQVLGANDRLFGHFKVDKGLQATTTSLLNPVFDADSPQPQYEGQLNETRTFSPNLTNQFLFATTYYRAIFTNTSLAQANSQVPFSLITLGGDFANNVIGGYVGAADFVFPQGRNVTGYQFEDDLSWSRANHTIKVGWTIRRDDVTDYDPSITTTPEAVMISEGSFAAGDIDIWTQAFPRRLTQPVALYAMGAYAQDQWKVTPSFTLTYGLRLEHDSNPICVTDCFANFATSFSDLSAAPTTPYDQLIDGGRHRAFRGYQHVGYEPRIGFAYLPFGPDSHTTIRAGFGMFADAFPGQIADALLGNAPTSVAFTVTGLPIDPSVTGSAGQSVTASDAAFVPAYNAGGSLQSLSATVPGFSAPNFTESATHVSYPTYEEWSLAVEHQLDRATALSIGYVGNRGYHEPVQVTGPNASGVADIASLPANPPNPSFARVTEIYSGSNSNYNGLVATLVRRSKWTSVQVNYMYQHALDETSNGGFDGFSGNSVTQINPYNLAQQYGNADYDVRHYVSGSYVVTIPHWRGPRAVTDGWQVAGTVFHSTGLPFSVIDSAVSGGTYAGTGLAMQTGDNFDHHCGGAAHTFNFATGSGTGCNFASDFAPATNFGQQGRNQLTGSGYTDTDMDLTKGFKMPHWDEGQLRVGAQFFNLFNHPNFGQPNNDVEAAGVLGDITKTVNPPTSILGSFLGGDASPRLVQLKATFNF
jgi:Carboxypeptidase regulatory-like domain